MQLRGQHIKAEVAFVPDWFWAVVRCPIVRKTWCEALSSVVSCLGALRAENSSLPKFMSRAMFIQSPASFGEWFWDCLSILARSFFEVLASIIYDLRVICLWHEYFAKTLILKSLDFVQLRSQHIKAEFVSVPDWSGAEVKCPILRKTWCEALSSVVLCLGPFGQKIRGCRNLCLGQCLLNFLAHLVNDSEIS